VKKPSGLAVVIHIFLKGKAKRIGVDRLVKMDAENATVVAILESFL
jgi:hypothetical protein